MSPSLDSSKLSYSLGESCIRGLKKFSQETIIIDTFQQNRELSGGMLLAVGWALSEWIHKNIPDKRIGIVLPPGIGGMAVNLACILAGKTPVNLNFTMGRAANEVCLELAELTSIITAKPLIHKLQDFPWTENQIAIEDVFKSIGKTRIAWKKIQISLSSVDTLIKKIGLAPCDLDQEAALLFTSGSSGNPKAVVLSHKNIVANVWQTEAVLSHEFVKSVMGCLPIFHSFGFTVTVFWPILCGTKVVTHISPLDTSRVIKAIRDHKVELFITTPTFLKSYMKKAQSEEFQSLKMVITGAEKLPLQVLETFEEKFAVPVCEGYGMTEATPVIAVNLPDMENPHATAGHNTKDRKIGTVGKLLPEIQVRVTDAETGEDKSLHESGMLWFKGPNIFKGYLKQPDKTNEVLKEGWYCSGDLGHLDKDNFLTIDGRVSRFSKIAGEMVPHATVEGVMHEILTKIAGEEVGVAIMGVRDEQKGESLVALVTKEVNKTQWQKEFAQKKLPNLWMPKHIVIVEEIPLLASGKLDLRTCQTMATEMVAA